MTLICLGDLQAFLIMPNKISRRDANPVRHRVKRLEKWLISNSSIQGVAGGGGGGSAAAANSWCGWGRVGNYMYDCRSLTPIQLSSRLSFLNTAYLLLSRDCVVSFHVYTKFSAKLLPLQMSIGHTCNCDIMLHVAN